MFIIGIAAYSDSVKKPTAAHNDNDDQKINKTSGWTVGSPIKHQKLAANLNGMSGNRTASGYGGGAHLA